MICPNIFHQTKLWSNIGILPSGTNVFWLIVGEYLNWEEKFLFNKTNGRIHQPEAVQRGTYEVWPMQIMEHENLTGVLENITNQNVLEVLHCFTSYLLEFSRRGWLNIIIVLYHRARHILKTKNCNNSWISIEILVKWL